MRADRPVHALADTGALLAFLHESDAWHAPCVEAFGSLRFPLGTSSAVLTELFHLLGANPAHEAKVWQLMSVGAITLLPITDSDCPALERLMRRYADRPMDFADATLVHLAERESVSTVFTVDNDDFETYRIGKRKRFHVVPGRNARH